MEAKPDCLVSFYVPCFNEQGNIGRTIDTLVGIMADRKESYEIVVVDDKSSDGSLAEIEDRTRRYPETRFQVVRNRFNRGLGRNYFLAAHMARGEHYMLINGDAAEPPETIRAILSHRGEADAVVPYFAERDTRTIPRRLLSRAFTLLVNILSGTRLKYYNGPVLHRTENVRHWSAETAGFGYQAELLCRLLTEEKITVVEVSVANSDRERGASKALRLMNLLSVANSLFHIFLRRFQRLSFEWLSPRP